MALEMKQSMRLSQQLVITPQLQQAIKLLQLSRLELADLIQQELEENPCLEEEVEETPENASESQGELHEQAKTEDHGHEHANDEVGTAQGEMKEPANFDWENYVDTFNSSELEPREHAGNQEEVPTYENFLRKTETLHDHLLWQLGMGDFSNQEKELGTTIIGNIDDDGYLTASIEEIAAEKNLATQTVGHLLSRIQDFDPTGVAARDLKECLLLQARHLGEDAPDVSLLIQYHLPDLERRDYVKICKATMLSEERIKELAHLISALEPKPGRPFSSEAPQYILPDVFVQKNGDDYLVSLNEDGLPRLQVSNFYRRSLMKGSDVAGQTKEYIQDRLRAAMWLIKSIHQRQRTLYRVAKSIVKFQKKFFNEGVSGLRPLILKDVAEDIEMHESTISRVTTNKYMHTPRGIFELKYFFNSGVQQDDGDGMASEAIKLTIKNIIEKEESRKPLSDQAIVHLLKAKKIDIARRTVAKYRETLGILPSSKRRMKS
ncbi:MAG: RNA polymerase factor sigma-54 [Deltaproteobacteria bacterium]|nr:RNA polymerase factor sigma-54 [Deltaproteobacteria bacterium]